MLLEVGLARLHQVRIRVKIRVKVGIRLGLGLGLKLETSSATSSAIALPQLTPNEPSHATGMPCRGKTVPYFGEFFV